MTLDSEAETFRPCPACQQCTTCMGTGKIICTRCPLPHQLDCPGDSTCGLCQGTRLVSHERRVAWLRINPDPPSAA